jgi:NTP pyrophosphatase (non-canonical NTP hydrolase)
MLLCEAMDIIWENRRYITLDPKQALSHLNEEVAESLKALLRGDEERAKKELEDALSCLFIALRVLDMDPESVVKRQVETMGKRRGKVMVIKEDRAEIYVNGELKGGWAIWGPEDREQAIQIATEFACDIIEDI